ncbi:M56 family metallopeptidase [Croceicoccus bisphenolivorans]|uniref:M56 family metallopeptidase n=1 Tax=Croceicoccus bisphenolivorans TaxID=1783232 RepID=UPI0008345F3E|nr:M56 family metallopeptidase [Croceicoccus bisphenolivorans]
MTGDWFAVVSGWAVDTALYTGALIAAVLVLRRPVARVFGARTAYALWLLPLMRFVLPPIVLPAWMRPAEVSGSALTVDPASLPVVADTSVAEPLVTFAMVMNAAIAVWLVGAVLFLGWRIACYRAMTRHLTDGAWPVGDAGSIRLVETPAVSAPVAFGVRRRVIALPPGFMASEDVAARDFAIAHEIAHHRGQDLIANLAAQPLLALHWFNPLAWIGWRAMRRDQEAACDARVMAGRTSEDRARYGEVIAACSREQSTAPRLMLAAPMAGFREIGPVLGEKAIVHRLRSLGMNTTTRRHRTGLLLVGTAGLAALSATASVSYAEAEPSAVGTTDVPASSVAEAADAAKIHMIVKDGEGGDFEWHSDGEELPPEEQARIEAELKRAEAEIERAGAEIERAHAEHERAMEKVERVHKMKVLALTDVPEVEEKVSADGKVRTVRIFRHAEGGERAMVREMVIDEGRIERDAIQGAIRGIEKARAALAGDASLSAVVRSEVLAELDGELEELRAELAGN